MKAKRFLICSLIAVLALAAGVAVWIDVLPRVAYGKRTKQFDSYAVKDLEKDGSWRKKRLEMTVAEYTKLKEELLRDKWYDETYLFEGGTNKPSTSHFSTEERSGMKELLAHVYTPYPCPGILDARSIGERLYVMIQGDKAIILYESYLMPVNSDMKW